MLCLLHSGTSSLQGEIGKALSGFDQWPGILGDRPESSPPVRSEVVLGRNSYAYDASSGSMIKKEPRGAYIYDGWEINVGDKWAPEFSRLKSAYVAQVLGRTFCSTFYRCCGGEAESFAHDTLCMYTVKELSFFFLLYGRVWALSDGCCL